MAGPVPSPARGVRFGSFELDLAGGDLCHKGSRVRISDQPLQILRVLVERPGEVVTREELQRRLWGDNVFVDFEHALNAAVRRLRRALHDSAARPRFIETIPTIGYRFLAPLLEGGLRAAPMDSPSPSADPGGAQTAGRAVAVAILPFKPSGPDATNGLAFGFTDAMTTQLGCLRQILVRPTRAVCHATAMYQDPISIARTLHADTLVDGFVELHGCHLHVSARIVDGRTGTVRWVKAFEGDDRLALQNEIASGIADRLSPATHPDDVQRLRKRYTASAAAYQLYSEGRYFWTCWTAEAMHHAIRLFKQAIAEDPAFALAHAGLADTYCLLGYQGMVAPRLAWPLAREAAIRALELDDTLAEAHAALGMVSLTYEWNWAEAEMSFRRAVTLGPNSAGAHLTFAIYLYAVAHFAEATREIRLAEDLDPISPIIKVMICNGFFFTRQYEENLRHARQLAAACPDHPLAHSVLGLAYDSLGRHDEAVSELRKAVELTQEAGIAAILGRSYAVAGRRQEARAVIADLETRNEREYVPWLRLGTIYFALGERERAFECLERAYAERDGWMMWAGVDPHLDSFRDDQRFADVLRRLAFPASVNSTIPSRAPLPRPTR